MADLKDSIQKSKEERMKKLEALRKAKQERENARSHNTQFLEPSMREDMNRSYNSDLSLSVSADSGHNSSIIVPKSDYGIKSISKVYLVPKPKTIAYERGIQVEIQTDSEDEEQADTMKGVRTAGFERVTKPDKKEEDENAENAKIKEIDPEEAEKIVASQEFWNFFSKCSNIIEKALDEQFDAAEDFILQQKIEDAFEQKSKLKLLQMLHYKDEERCVSSLEWSPHFDDMIVASYFKSDSIESKLPHGVVNIWHLEDASKPKHTVYCQSSITQAQICPSDPNLLLAGSYGGQLLIWDLRSKSLPIQRSPQFSKGHSFPIVGVAFAESRHSSNVISLSSDGKFCVWVMNYFQNPSETFEIKNRHDLCINCLDFSSEEPWSYTVGTEDGNVLNGVLQGSMSMEKDEIAACLMAPITSVQNHPNSECGLLLVGSVDWTVKLYQKGGQKQLMTIDAYDEYVYDVKWSPTNPCIFASADGGGNLDVWDLGKSLETPYTKQVTSSRALNKLAWDNNGYRIAAGNSASAIYVYQMDKEYSHNKNDDWIKALLGHLQIPESS